jgi:hypothetical protein
MPSYASIEDVRGEDYIDSRDLIELLDELRERPLSLFEAGDFELLAALEELESECVEDWSYGAMFTREDCFEDYARDFAESIGAISSNAQWPLACIDWAAAAKQLAQDYRLVSFLGHNYYVR